MHFCFISKLFSGKLQKNPAKYDHLTIAYIMALPKSDKPVMQMDPSDWKNRFHYTIIQLRVMFLLCCAILEIYKHICKLYDKLLLTSISHVDITMYSVCYYTLSDNKNVNVLFIYCMTWMYWSEFSTWKVGLVLLQGLLVYILSVRKTFQL